MNRSATVRVPVGITPEGVVIDVTLDAEKYDLIRTAIRHQAFTEAEQAVRAEMRNGNVGHGGLLLAARIVADLREGRAT